jgi:hypothetical protein
VTWWKTLQTNAGTSRAAAGGAAVPGNVSQVVETHEEGSGGQVGLGRKARERAARQSRARSWANGWCRARTRDESPDGPCGPSRKVKTPAGSTNDSAGSWCGSGLASGQKRARSGERLSSGSEQTMGARRVPGAGHAPIGKGRVQTSMDWGLGCTKECSATRRPQEEKHARAVEEVCLEGLCARASWS